MNVEPRDTLPVLPLNPADIQSGVVYRAIFAEFNDSGIEHRVEVADLSAWSCHVMPPSVVKVRFYMAYVVQIETASDGPKLLLSKLLPEGKLFFLASPGKVYALERFEVKGTEWEDHELTITRARASGAQYLVRSHGRFYSVPPGSESILCSRETLLPLTSEQIAEMVVH